MKFQQRLRRVALTRLWLASLVILLATIPAAGQSSRRARSSTAPPAPSQPKPADPTAAPRVITIFGQAVDANPLSNPGVNSLQLTLGDNEVARFDFQNGMVFPFFGQFYTSMFISSNGFVTFGQASNDVGPSTVRLIAGPPRIAAFWTDLDPTISGNIMVNQLGSEFVLVEWNGVADTTELNQVRTNTFALIIARTGAFQYLYGDVQSTTGLVGFAQGGRFFTPAQQVDFSQLASAPNGVNRSLPVLFESFSPTRGADVRNTSVVFFNTDKLTDPGLQSILRPSALGSSRSAQVVFIEDPLGRLSRNAIVRIDGLPVKYNFVNNRQLSVPIAASFLREPGMRFVDVDFRPGVAYVTGLPLVVRPEALFITSVTPNAIQVNDFGVRVQIEGFGFMSGAKVTITDFARGLSKTVTPQLTGGIFTGPFGTPQPPATSLSFTLPSEFVSREADLFFTVTNLGNRTATSTEDLRTHLLVVRSPLSVPRQ